MHRFRYILFLFLLPVLLNAGPGRILMPGKNSQDLRPDGLSETYLSPDGNFALHYTKAGPDTVPLVYTRNPAVPDYILNASEYLEQSRRLIRDTLNISAPPADDIKDSRIDIYFRRLPYGTYGQTTAETLSPMTDRSRSYTAFAEIHSTLTGPGFYTEGNDALKVTCAHELFHIFQVGIGIWDIREDLWFYEVSSTWIEDRAFPNVNDYLQYLGRYAVSWGKPLTDYTYDNITWLLYLQQRFGDAAVTGMWTNMKKEPAWDAATRYLRDAADDASPWPEILADWGMHHIYADYAPSRSLYPDATLFPPIQFSVLSSFNFTELDSMRIKFSAEPYSSNFLRITGITSGRLKVRVLSPSGTAGEIWNAAPDASALSAGSAFSDIAGDSTPWTLLLSTGSGDTGTGSAETVTVELDEADSGLISLSPNPLPGNMPLKLAYNLKSRAYTGKIRIYDITGRTIASYRLRSDELTAGLHNLPLMLPTHTASGVYLLFLQTGTTVSVEKFTVIK